MHFLSVNTFKSLSLLILFVLVDGAVFEGNDNGDVSPGKALIGGACTTFSDCPENAGCRNGKLCVCSSGYIHSATMEKCLKFGVALGEECEEYQQCQEGIKIDSFKTCNQGRCDCTSDGIAVQVNGTTKCVRLARYGTACQVHDQCVAQQGPSLCDGGVCYCMRGYKISSDRICVLEEIEP